MHRDNHYEAAFEAFLRARRLPYIAVDEARRSLVADGSLKSLDFIVSPPGQIVVAGRREGPPLSLRRRAPSVLEELVDARRPAQPGRLANVISATASARCWCSPTTSSASRSPLPREQLFEFRGGHYGFLGVRLADYVPHARPLSDSWDTVAMPTGLFRRAARPLDDWLGGSLLTVPFGPADWQELPADLEWEA